ncbi:MAG TPA: gluconokinase [Candidatus Limnocylindrales bacterium]|nr:gluconokinase [Candidatus Limnocylindrales bacterium]
MGVSASGKSTVMAALASRLGWPTLEGDAIHPPGNVAKMAAGVPLTDEDRRPWLEAISAWIGERERARESSIVACSALRRPYRELLRRGHPSVWFVSLDVPRAVLESRMATRAGHFMPASLLDSQLEALEPLATAEPGTTIAAVDPPGELADRIIETLRLEPR